MAFTSLTKKTCLGIDIGSSSVRIIELSRLGERVKLENYSEVRAEVLYRKPFRTFEKNTLMLLGPDIARAVKAGIDEARMITKRAIFSIPDFSTFYTTFELPPMTEEEMPEAIRFQAREHIPVPLSEVTLDWSLIKGETANHNGSKLRILLVAVPNEVINQYQEISQMCGLELVALEPEAFGLIRSANLGKKRIAAIIDIGAQSTTCSLVDRGVLKQSRSFETAGNEMTEVLSRGLQVDLKEADALKRKYGILPNEEPKASNVREVLTVLIDFIINEVDKTFQGFIFAEGKAPDLVILAGGLAVLPGLKEYFAQRLGKETIIINPFADIFYPPILEKTLKETAPSYAIAVGAALRGTE